MPQNVLSIPCSLETVYNTFETKQAIENHNVNTALDRSIIITGFTGPTFPSVSDMVLNM